MGVAAAACAGLPLSPLLGHGANEIIACSCPTLCALYAFAKAIFKLGKHAWLSAPVALPPAISSIQIGTVTAYLGAGWAQHSRSAIWLFPGNGRRPNQAGSSGRGDIIDVTPLQTESRAEARSNEDPRGKKKKGEKFRRVSGHLFHNIPLSAKMPVWGPSVQAAYECARRVRRTVLAETCACYVWRGTHARSTDAIRYTGMPDQGCPRAMSTGH